MAMTDCHDWFAEVAESYVSYLVARAGYEVFGQSEWGADLAIRDSASGLWARCEVRSSYCKAEPKRKWYSSGVSSAEISADVTLAADRRSFRVLFHKQNACGQRIVPVTGGLPIRYDCESSDGLRTWLDQFVFMNPTAANEVGRTNGELQAT